MYQENAVVKAIEHLTQLIEASPWSVDFLEARAECHEHRGMYDDAILDLRYFWNQNSGLEARIKVRILDKSR